MFKNIEPIENIIIAYSLNPEVLINEFEQKTPKLKKRIDSIKFLQRLGWKVGLRFDPLINYRENKLIYKNFFNHVFSQIQPEKIHSVTAGSFRMPNNFFNKLVNMRPEDSLIFNRLQKENLSKDHSQKKECEKELGKFFNKKIIFAN